MSRARLDYWIRWQMQNMQWQEDYGKIENY